MIPRSAVRLLISGVPATGKSTFARWLRDEHGFIYHDVDSDPKLPVDDLTAAERAVIDWGFPAYDPDFQRALEAVRSLIDSGFAPWWFDGDRVAARESFIARATVASKAWDRQLAGIVQHWPDISAVFEGQRIVTISAGPTFISVEQIFQRMFPAGLEAEAREDGV